MLTEMLVLIHLPHFAMYWVPTQEQQVLVSGDVPQGEIELSNTEVRAKTLSVASTACHDHGLK